jgi:hypothetical protein
MVLKAKATACYEAATTLVDHTREEAESVLLKEMWGTLGNKKLNYKLVLTNTILSADAVMLMGTYYFQATDGGEHTRVTLNVALDTNSSIPNTSKQEYVKLMANNALSYLRLHAEDIKDRSTSTKASTPVKRNQMGRPIVTDGLSRVYKLDKTEMNTADLANAGGPNEDTKPKEQERQLKTEELARSIMRDKMGRPIVTDGLSRGYKIGNAEMNTTDTANARGPNEDAKYKQQDRQLNTEKLATQRWLLETHSQRLAYELMENTINCPATSAHQFKQSKIMDILMTALETEDFDDKQERRRAARSSYFVGVFALFCVRLSHT